ncbi:hypothetical protein BC941DRAFT_429441 [Chlamydoabsidia padenii]|nr:hypothetical protein BC941DRAFT_429441 [Chlamydoabsidia padenii]
MENNNNTWFYIQSTKTGHVVSACRQIQNGEVEAARSQVHVYAPLQTDDELWTWSGQYIRNKATSLVLDIRKGRLRLIEDTEICLYQEKPLEAASNQLWGVRDAAANSSSTLSHGKLIYSISNADWTLMQDGDRLLLYPQEPLLSYDTWDLVAEGCLLPSLSSSSPTTTTSEWNGPTTPGNISSLDYDYPQGGLTPAKRGSQGSVNLYSMDSFKDYHDRLYREKDTHLSDKAISMAIAYHSWIATTLDPIKEDDESSRIQLQNQAEQEALDLLLSDQYQDHHKETVIHLTSRYVTLLIDQKVSTS